MADFSDIMDLISSTDLSKLQVYFPHHCWHVTSIVEGCVNYCVRGRFLHLGWLSLITPKGLNLILLRCWLYTVERTEFDGEYSLLSLMQVLAGVGCVLEPLGQHM